ncbi:uncharacterized protein AKAW2_50778S [Aspergillus luchuensis]|uniref:Uncharacterized protein n=1 Tax=Aspergillus kawachii TaxID=1069201 RepID=A0A7R7WCI6_ASPKA|nr:uncharacterized protein AKAW2_50778S [Aspergillus luchuensis]BCS00437.1 hypothetical protein AKAW2_50778S [Aspergillus luchuensis]
MGKKKKKEKEEAISFLPSFLFLYFVSKKERKQKSGKRLRERMTVIGRNQRKIECLQKRKEMEKHKESVGGVVAAEGARFKRKRRILPSNRKQNLRMIEEPTRLETAVNSPKHRSKEVIPDR